MKSRPSYSGYSGRSEANAACQDTFAPLKRILKAAFRCEVHFARESNALLLSAHYIMAANSW